MDMFLDICRKNEILQKAGFFQKETDNLAMETHSFYERVIEKNSSGDINLKNLQTLLSDIYKQANKVIETNLVYANLILDQPDEISGLKPTLEELKEKISTLYTDMKSISLKGDSLSTDVESAIKNL